MTEPASATAPAAPTAAAEAPVAPAVPAEDAAVAAAVEAASAADAAAAEAQTAGGASAKAPAGATASGYNLKVLPASWSKDQVKDYMKKVVSAGLGVKCDFCHDVDDFAADTNKHKVIARGMMVMTDELNKKHWKDEPRLSCMTCHNGKKEPKHP